MRNLNTVGLLAGIALAVGMIGVNVSDGTFSVLDKTSEGSMEAGMFRGHLEIIHTDPDGNVLSYQQTDNAIMSEGEMCVARALFGSAAAGTGATRCLGDPGTFNVIALDDTTTVGSSLDAKSLPSELTAAGLYRQDVTAGNGTISIPTEASGAASDAVARVSNTFQFSAAGPQTVLAAALLNSTTTTADALFAMKNFPSSVTLNLNDQLTVNWDITISGTDAFS